jgi:hypothetical protein
MRAMEDDLQWINTTTAGGSAGGVYILGHYPQISSSATFVPPRFHHLVRGAFAGHTHNHIRTNLKNLFTQVGSVDPAGSNSFMIAEIAAGNGYRVVVDPARDAYTFDFKGKPGDISSPQDWKKAQAPPKPPPGTPTPPPTPPTPTPPTPSPVPRDWKCYDNMDNHRALTKPPFNLVDHDITEGITNVAGCEHACVASSGCVVVVWHASDLHCHTLTGAVTHEQFVATLNATKQSTACMHIPVPATAA